MWLRSRRVLPLLLLPLALVAALVAAPAVARADTLSWSRTYAGPPNIPNGDADPIPVAGGFNAVSFADATRGWAVGVRVDDVVAAGTPASFVAFSANGGASWAPIQVSAVTAELHGVLARSTTDVWVVGNAGTIARWDGISWTKRTVAGWPSTKAFRAVAFADADNGWAVGDGLGVVRTSDGGASWSIVATPAASATPAYRAIATVGPTGAVAVGDSGKGRRLSTVGASSVVTGLLNNLYGVAFSDATHGWAVGDGGTFLKTSDAGATWSPVAVPLAEQGTFASPRAVSFADPLDGVIVGQYQATWRTSDGGASWTVEHLADLGTLDDLTLRGAAFVPGSADHPVAVGRMATLTSSDDKARAYLGAWSGRVPPAPVAPTAPTGLSVARGGALGPSALVTWTDTSADEAGFVVERAQSSAGGPYAIVATLDADVTSWTDSGVDWGSTWFYRVTSYRGALSSASAASTGFKADTTPPTTASDAAGPYVASATITLSASDPGGSGVVRTSYALDGGAAREGMVVRVTAAGPHSVAFWSEDAAGNVEGAKTALFTVVAPDTTAPVTTSDTAPEGYVSGAVVRLTATDAVGVAHTYYTLDGGPQAEGATISTTVLGLHTLEFWSVDAAFNVEAHKTVTFLISAPQAVDTAAPVTTSDAKAAYVGLAVIRLSPTDDVGVADTHYALDGGAQRSGTTVAVSAPGPHTLVFWSEDWAGNLETHRTATFTITAPPVLDTTAPVSTSDAKATYVASAIVRLAASDAVGVTGTYYTVDSGAQTSGTTIVVSTLGSHTIAFWSVDAAGNIEARKIATFTITAAPVGPAPTSLRSKASATSPRHGAYVTISSVLTGGVPAGSHVRYQVRLPGKSSYTTLSSTRDVSASGASSYRYKLPKKGTYYFRPRFLGVTGFAASISNVVKVVAK